MGVSIDPSIREYQIFSLENTLSMFRKVEKNFVITKHISSYTIGV